MASPDQSEDEVSAVTDEAIAEVPDMPIEPQHRPWAEGVSASDQEQALSLFRQGNELFAEAEYSDALQRYRDALSHWSHPAIHGNLAICMVHLDDPIGAYKHVGQALRWGAAPFEPHVHQQLLTNRTLLMGQLAHVEIECDEDGAELALDGETLFEGPSRATRVVRAGEHRVVASKPGFLTYNRVITVLPGQTEQVRVELVPLEAAARYERRWPQWMPWVVLASGVVVTGLGVGLQLSAAANIESYEDEIGRLCQQGCPPEDVPEAVQDLETRGVAENRAAIVLLSVGGAAIGTGVALLLLNRLKRVDVDASGTPLSLSPVIGPNVAGATLRLQL